MRSAIAPDAARRAAARRSTAQAAALTEAAAALAATDVGLGELQERAVHFWSVVVDAADNLAYRLAYNALRDTYDRSRVLLATVLADELRDAAAYDEIAAAVRNGAGERAHGLAATLVGRGEEAVARALRAIAGHTEGGKE
jgi:DNA-binding FadR family transcriptional regulator